MPNYSLEEYLYVRVGRLVDWWLGGSRFFFPGLEIETELKAVSLACFDCS